MKERLILVLFWALVLHLIVSVAFILDPPFLEGRKLSIFYRKYVLPGPFFKDSKIIDNYSLALSWKVNDKWMASVNPAEKDFKRYHATLNPSDFYRSKISYTIQLFLSGSSETDIKSRKEFPSIKQFLYDKYVPIEADSVQVWIVNNQAKNFGTKKDSVYVIFSR